MTTTSDRIRETVKAEVRLRFWSLLYNAITRADERALKRLNEAILDTGDMLDQHY